MSQAIRSEVDKQIISLCCRVLLNLARYKPTRQNVFQVSKDLGADEITLISPTQHIVCNISIQPFNSFQQIHHFETVAQILYRWCDKDCDIFNVLCTLLYVFIQCPIINQVKIDSMIKFHLNFDPFLCYAKRC